MHAFLSHKAFISALMFIFCGLGCLKNNLHAQETDNQKHFIQVSGFILESENLRPIPFAHVLIPSNRLGVISDASGFYNILIEAKDSLEFSAIGFEVVHFGLPTGISSDYFSYNVLLKPIRYDLETYDFNQFNYARVVEKIRQMGVDEKAATLTDENLAKGVYLSRPGTGILLSGPFTRLYNKFSRQAREMAKLQELLNNENQAAVAQSKLTPELIESVTGLSKEDLDEFVRFCDMGKEFVATATTYDLMIALGRCHDEFVKAFPELAPNDSLQTTPNKTNEP